MEMIETKPVHSLVKKIMEYLENYLKINVKVLCKEDDKAFLKNERV